MATAPSTVFAFRCEVDQAPPSDGGHGRQGDVLAHGALHEQGLGAIGRHVHEAGPDGVGGMSERGRRAVHEEFPAGRARGPREHVEELVLALAFECDDAEHLARVELEGCVLQFRAGADGPGRQPRCDVRRALPGCRSVGAGLREVRGFPAEHQFDDAVLRARRDVDDADGDTFAENGGPVADRSDLDHAVGDEEDRALAAALTSDDLEDAFREVGRQGRGHLIEHEDVGLDGEGTREVDDPERSERHAPSHRREVEIGKSQLGEPVPERLERGLREAQVGPDVQVRDQRRLLVDRDEPSPAGLPRRVDDALATADGDRTPVGPHGTREDLHERALPGAVRAHERVNLARTNTQRRRSQGDHSAVRLRDVRRLEQEVRGRDGHVLPGVRCGEGMPAFRHPLRLLVAETA